MSIRNVTVGTSPLLVPGSNPDGFGDDVTIFNTGTAAAYLDSDHPDTTTAGLPLTAGSSCIWSKGQPLWVVAPAATTLTVSDNSGAVFDAGGVASQILSQGLAAQIAAAINVVGVPPIDTGDVLLNSIQPVAAGVAPLDEAIVCTKYQTLRCSFNENCVVSTAPRLITITWYADATHLLQIGQDTFTVPTSGMGGLANAAVSVPTRGPYAVFNSSSVTNTSTGCSRLVIGSYRPTQSLTWTETANGLATSSGFVSAQATGINGGTFSMSGVLPVGTTIDYPLLRGGACGIISNMNAITGICEVNIRDTYNNRFVYDRRLPVSGSPQSFYDLMVLPNSPCSLQVTIAGGAVQVQISIISVDKP